MIEAVSFVMPLQHPAGRGDPVFSPQLICPICHLPVSGTMLDCRYGYLG
ncbi:hypothetical protein B932_1687 [Gluconobacter oxydans H24]|nr:hypothetical protein B932_1687 [Gluconobacter oxydans H24]